MKSMGDDVYEHGAVSKSRGGEIVCRPYVTYTYSITYQVVQDIGRSQCGGGEGYHIALHTKVANHQRKPNKPKKPKGPSQKHSKTIEKTKKNKKTRILANYEDKHAAYVPIVCPDPWFFLFFLVFSMVLLCFLLGSLGCSGFSGFGITWEGCLPQVF